MTESDRRCIKYQVKRTLLGAHVVVAAPVERRREAVRQVADAGGVEELLHRVLGEGKDERPHVGRV